MSRRGFSLLELVLALGLTVMIVGAISAAVYQYMFHLAKQQKDIERKQIVRGVVRMIGEDLRAAIQYKPQDYSGLENLVESQSLAGLGGMAGGLNAGNTGVGQPDPGDPEAGGGQLGGPVESGSGNSPQEAGAADEDVEQEDEPVGRPTLIGNEYVVRVDTSRLPRLDEYNPLVARRQSEDRLPSDIKTVTYFFSQVAPTTRDPYRVSFGQNGGLYRRQIDRAVEAYLGDENISTRPDNYCDLISPEVAAISFRYWDGEQWRAEWDSAVDCCFPLAIEVKVAIDPDRATQDNRREQDALPLTEFHRTVIHLPMAELPPEEEEEAE